MDLIVIKYLTVAPRETRVKFTREGKAPVNNLIKALNVLSIALREKERKRGREGITGRRRRLLFWLFLRGTMNSFALFYYALDLFLACTFPVATREERHMTRHSRELSLLMAQERPADGGDTRTE